MRTRRLAALFLGAWVLLVGTPASPPLAADEADRAPSFHGIVTDARGAAVADADVFLRAPGGACDLTVGIRFARTRTDAHGRFALPLPAAPMEVYAVHPKAGVAWAPARDEVVLEMSDPAWLEVALDVPADVTVSRGPWQFARVQTDGVARLGPLPPGLVLSLSVAAPTRRPWGTRQVLGEGETRPVVPVMDRGLSVEGRVWPAQEGVTLRAHQAEGHELVATSDQEGRFLLTGLAEGWVRVVATSPGRPLLVLDATAGEALDVRWDR